MRVEAQETDVSGLATSVSCLPQLLPTPLILQNAMVIVAHVDINPQVTGFILYCTRERRKWPSLYDEMCRVAGQGLYQGLHHKELRKMGLSLSLQHIDRTIQIIEAVTDAKIGFASLGSPS